MTSHAPPTSPEPTTSPAHELGTAPAGPPDTEPILDSLELLDHRTRSRAIPRRTAPFGHYLAFGQDGVDRLVPIEVRVTHIGGGLPADVRLEEQRVSGTHAILVRHGHQTRLLDNR